MLIRRTVLDKVGLLYTKYWAYWEETDFVLEQKKLVLKSFTSLNLRFGTK